MAWSIVGINSPGAVTSTALTLTEPAGVIPGDLLVACISSRTTSTASITLPAGWTLVGEQKTNNTLTTTSAVASGMMAYIVRGASAPAGNFTLPAGLSVAMPHVIAYRGNATIVPLDAATAVTTAINTIPVSVAGLTTTQADDLIVAMCAGGQEATWSAFNNVTTPIGASGATNTTTAPSSSAWIERIDVATTTGADVSQAVFDAVRTGTGATGNLTATASLGAGHVVIAGAFKILLPTANAWSNADKSAAITLTNSDKKATLASATVSGVRSTTTYANGTAGKYYAEFFLNGTAIPDNIGITPTSNSLTSESFNWHVDSGGLLVVNSSGFETISIALNDVVCVAWDAGAERAWFRSNGGNWNNSGTANPATGTGGLDCSFAASTQHALWMRDFNTIGAGATIRTELAEFTQTVPSGFSSWMGEAPPTADAWSNVDKSANITLSNSDKTATSTSATTAGIRSDQKHVNETAGKYYAEIYIVTKTGGINLGIQRTSTAVTTTTNAVVNYGTGTGALSVNSVNVATIATATSGDVACFAWDAGAQRIWVRKNGDLWNADAGADPVAGTNGLDASALAAEDFALWGISTASGNVVTIRTEAAEFTQSGPAGFTSWMGEALGPTAYTLPAVAGSYALTGVAASLEKSRFITADASAYALTGAAATLTKGAAVIHYDLPAVAGSYALTGATAGLYRGREVLAVAGSYALSGQTANLEYGREATADAGSYALTGTVASLELGKEVLAIAGAYAVSGAVANLEYGREVTGVAGSYTLIGTTATFRKTVVMPAAAAAYALTGATSSFKRTYNAIAVSGSYTLTGIPANLLKPGAYAIIGLPGAYTLSGTAASLEYGREVLAVAGAYALAGADVSLEKGRAVVADAGSYALAGATTSLEYGREVLAISGAYALTGAASSLEYSREVAAVGGSYALTGTITSLERGYEVLSVAGSYALTGTPANLLKPGAYAIIGLPGSYAISGAEASLTKGIETWTPAEIASDVLIWFDASMLVGSDGAIIVGTDSVPNLGDGPAMTNASVTLRTAALNGLNVIEFMGQPLTVAGVSWPADIGIYTIYKGLDTSGHQRLMDHSFSLGWWIGRPTNSIMGGGIQQTSDPYGIYVNQDTTSWHMLSFERMGSTQHLRANGGTQALTQSCSTAATSNTVPVTFGSNELVAFAETVMLDASVTVANRNNIEGYLAWKWGLEASLPVDHPYHDAPPAKPELPIASGGQPDGDPVRRRPSKRRRQIFIIVSEATKKLAKQTGPLRKKRRKLAKIITEEVLEAAGGLLAPDRLLLELQIRRELSAIPLTELHTEGWQALQDALMQVITDAEHTAQRLRAESEEEDDLLLLLAS